MSLLLLAAGLVPPQSPQVPPPLRPDPPPDDRFDKRVLLRGLARPMELEVAPDGQVFLIEVAGRVSVYDPSTAERRTVLDLDVFAEQENGLLGLALDPDFARTQWVYLLYSPTDLTGQRLARFDWDGTRLVPETEVVLLEFEEQRRECCHHAGSIEFGPGGLLFIAAGDNTHPHGDSQGYAPIDERPDRFPWDAQRSSANTAVLGGKVLRVRPTPEGTIEIPEGNLFPGGEGGRPEIYAMGCRNPWRIGVDQKTGFVYWGEVGPDAGGDGERGPRGYDEINQARQAGNFGWPLFIANNQPYAWVDLATGAVGARFDPERPVNRSPNNTGARVLPPAVPAWIYYPYGKSAEYPELDAPGGRTACAGPVYDFDASSDSPTRLPAWFDRGLFVFEWSRHWIKVVHLDEESNIASISPLPGGFTFKRPVDIDIAPDGTLYVLEYGETWNANPDSALVRIDYYPGNRPPRARATAQPTMGHAPLNVHLSAADTLDLDGDDLAYSWRGPDGALLGETAELDVQLATEGEHALELEVRDTSGAIARASVGVLVGNTPPDVALTSPVDGGFFDPGEELRWRLTVRDAEDGEPGDWESSNGDPQWWTEGTALRARFVPGAPPRTDAREVHPAVARMRASDCFNCHATERRVVGPSFLEVAERYAGDGEALERTVARVRAGSAEIWGSQPMLPHADLPPEALREMVAWVLALRAEVPTRFEQGFAGRIRTDADAPAGSWVFDATYEDGGGALESLPSLTGHARLVVRSRRVEAEHFTDRRGTQTLESENASSGAFIGSIYDGNELRLADVDLAGIRSVRASVSSNGVGGFFDLRRGSRDGPVLASFSVENNGAWEEWHTLEQPLDAPPGKADLFVRFRAGETQGALMNLDWLQFEPAGAKGQLSSAGERPPNVVYIMSDELAYFELSHMGNPYIRTPRIDRLASEGLRFTHAYAGSPVCAPLRCNLMTGKHAGHASVRANDGGTPLRAGEPTIASLLKARGYATGGFGKWGCGGRDSTGVPEEHGFDVFFGYYDQVHAHSFYPPYLVRNSEEVPLEGNAGGRSGATYSHYSIMDEALAFIRANKDQPFFCYLPITPPHGMYDIPADDPAWELYRDAEWMKDPAIGQDVKNYAAMVSLVDRNVGQVLDLLKELDLEEDTIVFFTGDNGGQDRFRSGAHPRGFFGPNVDPRTGVEFRGGKGNLFEGGLRIPSLARWPGRIEAGGVSDHVFYQPDVLPTLSALCGAAVPEDVDGLSFMPALLGEGEQAQHEFLYWEFGGQLAVRVGDWKGILKRKGRGDWSQVLAAGEAQWALFDLSRDVSEAHDVAAEHADVVAKLATIAAREFTPARPGTYTDRTRHERDRWAKWGTTKRAKPARPGKRAAVNTIEAQDLIPAVNLSLVRFSSQNESNGKLAANAIDGDPRTVWHTSWSDTLAEHPHELVIDLGAMYRVRGFRYLARQDSGWNGAFADTEFFLAQTADGFESEPVARATFGEKRTAQATDLDKAVTARYVKVRALSEVGGNAWGSAAELGVIGVRSSPSPEGDRSPEFAAETIGEIEIGYGLAIGDVDGDLRPDILLADKRRFVWYRNPDWKRFTMARDLTDHDNVCIAARDIDGDGKVEVAVGAGWNPGDTEGSGSVHYLVPPADRTQPWTPVQLPHEPVVHRMRWVRIAEDRFDLVVSPLHGRGNVDGQGAGARLLAYEKPDDVREPWKTVLLDDTLHLAHNFDRGQWLPASEAEEILYIGREGALLVAFEDGAWRKRKLPGIEGGGEIRMGRQTDGTRFLATISPLHGHRLSVHRWLGPPSDTREPQPTFASTVLDESFKGGHAIAVADLMGDEELEIVAGWRLPNADEQVGIKLFHRSNPGGNEWSSIWIDRNGMATEDLRVADLDGDGRADVVAAGRATRNLKIYWNREKD